MNSLPDTRRLLSFSEMRQRRFEQVLMRTQQQLQPLRQELADFAEQTAALHNLLDSHRAEDCVLDHGQLLALLRRQTGFNAQEERLKNMLQSFTQKYSNANSYHDNFNKTLSSHLNQFADMLKAMLNF